MKLIYRVVMAAVLVLTNTLVYGSNMDHVGIVKSLAGEVLITRNNQIIKAEQNLRLLEGDIVQTGPNGKVGLILEDDTVISMGFDSSIAIKNYIFQPNEKKLSFIASVFHGTVSFLSGQIAKLAPNQAVIETPYATIGSRGTHILILVD
jgi:hypothetical protein